MRRSAATYILIGALAALVAVLGVLQYRWMTQISRSEAEKAQQRVQENAKRFAADFNSEIQNAYFNFQTDAASWKQKDWAGFNERLEFWRARTSYPDLIDGFYFVEAAGDAQPLRYEAASASFLPAELSPELAGLKALLADEKKFDPVSDETDTLVLPIHETGGVRPAQMIVRSFEPGKAVRTVLPDKFGYLLIKLNRSVISERVLPDLANKYFGDGQFRTAVVSNSGQTIFGEGLGAELDTSTPLLDLTPDRNFTFFANRELLSAVGPEVGERVMNTHVESRTLNRVLSPSGAENVKIEIKKDAQPRTTIFTATTSGLSTGPWTLQIQHVSGSLGTFAANTLYRNLAVGFGLLLLLTFAIAAIIISSHRMRMLAQRQMDFVSSVSHEFRTPLAVIYSAGENLADGVAKENEQVARYGDLIKGEGRKLRSMVEQILDFAGARSGRRKYNFASAAAGDVVRDALAECRSLIDEKGISVDERLSDDLPSLAVDRAALSQAIQNLIANAVKYSDGQKWLAVSATNGDGKVKISVEDRGLGISKSDLRQIFEPFFRSREVVDAQIHGNGLGLSIVKQIVDAHGGTITAVSDRGKGSKFTITLPVHC